MEGKFQLKWYHSVADFVNFMRGVYGAGALALPFAFKQAGILPAVILIIATVVVSVYIIERLVNLKNSLVQIICKENGASEESEFGAMLQRRLTFQDIAEIAIGKWGRLAVQIMAISLQAGLATNYHIIFGNTLYDLIFKIDKNIDPARTEIMVTSPDNLILSLMVLAPLPVFIIFCFFRELRQFSMLSALVPISISLAIILSVIDMVIGFSAKKVALFKTDTALIGFMAILTAFEIIPIAIPLQSSMKGNHENFNKYIRIIVSVYACLLVPYGIFGYIRYGEGVQQLLSLNLPADPVLIVINCLLLLVGLFAYPMCMNPVIEFFEVRLFAEGGIFGPKTDTLMRQKSVEDELDAEKALLERIVKGISVPDTVPTWKRNVLRTILAVFVAAIAVGLKNYFAYLLAFLGALTSAPLLFIIPSLCHMNVNRHGITTRLEKALDFVFVAFGAIITVASIIVLIKQLKDGNV